MATISDLLHNAAAGLLVAGVLAAMLCDVTRFRIPNAIPLAIAALFPLFALTATMPAPWLSHLAAGGLALTVGLVLFQLRLFGGGDVKLIAAIALWLGLSGLPQFLMHMGLIGGVLGILLLGARALAGGLQGRRLPGEDALQGVGMPRLLRRGEPVPYAVAIGLATLLAGPSQAILGFT